MGRFLTDLDTTFRAEHFRGLSVMDHAHVHAQYELYFCTENVEQKSVINGIEYVYHYPCVILSSPYTVHSMSCEDANAIDFDRYVFYFDERMLASYKSQVIPAKLREMIGGRIFRLTDDQAEYLKKLLIWCNEASDSPSAVQQELSFLLFLNKLFEICSEDQSEPVDFAPDYIHKVLRYVAEHLSEPIDVQSVAHNFSVSRSKLDRDFKRLTKSTVHEYLESCRINQAKGLLCLTPILSIQEIAARCGFESETYFFPFFKRHTGITPLEYRNRHQKDSRVMFNREAVHIKNKGEDYGKDYIYGCGEHGIC